MKRQIFTIGLGIPLAAVTLAAAGNPARCISDWSDAARIVAGEKLETIESLSRAIAQRNLGTIVRATLCESEGKYFYRLILRTPAGTLRVLNVDARQPFG